MIPDMKNPTEYFYKSLPEYMQKYGPVISVRTAFTELMGEEPGIHMDLYKSRIRGISVHYMVHALQRLQRENKVEMHGHGYWKWVGNSENKGES